MLQQARTTVVLLVLLLGLPPFGVWLTGQPVEPYLKFPPLTRLVEHAGFSWLGFSFFVVIDLAMLVPVAVAFLRSPPRTAAVAPGRFRGLPWWGYLGLGWLLTAWVLAWSRFDWFAPLQAFTFSPLWLGYIVVVNALSWRRSGRSMLSDRPRSLFFLFVVSAAFWWFFEYLNRFVQNWYYIGIERFGPAEYVIYATLPFATVLPAVLGTAELLATFPRLTRALHGWPAVRIRRPRLLGGVTLALSAVGLAGIGVWPDVLYPLLWVAPLLIITSLQAIGGKETIFTPLARGDWRPVYLPALAGLLCGVFWEMWNYYSAAKWVYTVPYVYQYLVFEMPVVGFGGYLPFGIACAAVARIVAPSELGTAGTTSLPSGAQARLRPRLHEGLDEGSRP